MKTFDLNFFLEKIILREVGHDFFSGTLSKEGVGVGNRASKPPQVLIGCLTRLSVVLHFETHNVKWHISNGFADCRHPYPCKE